MCPPRPLFIYFWSFQTTVQRMEAACRGGGQVASVPRCFVKIWAKSGLFFVYFCPFLIPISITTMQIRKKQRWCAWDLNLWPLDGRLRQNHEVQAVPRVYIRSL